PWAYGNGDPGPGQWRRSIDRRRTMKMRISRLAVAAALALTAVSIPAAPVRAQIPGVGSLPGSMIPDKSALLDQAKKLVSDLTALKQAPKLPAGDAGKVDAMLPKANAVTAELDKPQVEPSRLAQLAGQLGDLQKQYGSLKGMLR